MIDEDDYHEEGEIHRHIKLRFDLDQQDIDDLIGDSEVEGEDSSA
jgi:hypothetical protein